MRYTQILPAALVGISLVSSVFADVVEDNITATSTLSSQGTLDVTGQSTFNGTVEINDVTIVDDGANTPWTTAPTGAYWNVLLEDGFFIWGDPSTSSSLGLDFNNGDLVMFWYPDKYAFRAVLTTSTSTDEANIGTHSFATGTGAYASGLNSIAMAGGHATAENAIALGRLSEASGLRSLALGLQSTASGQDSIALSPRSSSSGQESIAAGLYADASADYSIAVGRNTEATGDRSVSFGYESVSDGDNSVALGNRSEANSYAMTVVGSYNEIDVYQTGDSWVASDQLFVVGNGANSSSRSNAFVVYKNADADIAGDLSIAGDISLSHPAGGLPMGNFGNESP